MKLITIVNAYKTIDSLGNKEDIPASFSYKMAKYISKTDSDNSFYNSQIQTLFKKYGKETEQEGAWAIDPENKESFQKEVEELNNTEAVDPGIRFPYSELQGIKLSPKQMYSLLEFVDEER